MYHGIIIDQQFADKAFLKKFKIFKKKRSGNWGIYGIEISDSKVEQMIEKIQEKMKSEGTWYAHLYNDKNLIVIFKNKVFKVTPHKSTWKPVFRYGQSQGISKEQLDFWPNRFQDERHYFEDK